MEGINGGSGTEEPNHEEEGSADPAGHAARSTGSVRIMADHGAVREARRTLGAQLVRLRRAAGLTQHGLASKIDGYGRSTVANAETGHQTVHRDFWLRCDGVLDADGALIQAYDNLRAMARAGDLDAIELAHEAAFRHSGYQAAGSWSSRDDSRGTSDSSRALPAERRGDEPVVFWAGAGVHGQQEIVDMNRRDLLRLVTMTAASLAAPVDWERIDQAFAGGGRLDDEAVDEFVTLHGHLWQVFALSASKTTVLPAVRGQMTVLVESLRHPQSLTIRRRLSTLVADLYQLAGEIHFDSNSYTDAAQCYTLAATASREADAFDLWACALVRHAFISVYGRDYAEAMPMLKLAAGLANRGDRSLSTRHWVAAVQAQTFARLGRLDLCERALDTAEEICHLPGSVHNGGWLRFDGARLAEERGTCYVALGRTDLAQAALSTALPQLRSPRRRGGVLADLALIGVQRHDMDMLTAYADQAIELAQQTGSGYIAQRLLWLSAQLPRHTNDPRVNQVNQRIAAVTGASSSP